MADNVALGSRGRVNGEKALASRNYVTGIETELLGDRDGEIDAVAEPGVTKACALEL